MYTQCPHCQAVFRVTTADLTLQDGQVRCGECMEVFNGMNSLSVLPPEELVDMAPKPSGREPAPHGAPAKVADRRADAETAALPDVEAAVEPPQPPPEEPEATTQAEVDETRHASAPSAAGRKGAATVPLALKDELEAANTGTSRRHVASTLGLGLLCLALIGLLGAQVLYHERERLAVYPELSPVIDRICATTGCTTAERREPQAFQVTQRNIYSHPNAVNALMVQASFVNGAGFTQSLPQVELSFRDLQGSLVAVRRFSPQEYLPQGQAPEPVAPRASVDLRLEIEDPGPRAVAYEFRFL
ncbi:DUF3426 domain-containing protein [Thioalkalivibrio sulfidiphilus]|uniref:DUF3426 domain-containing protein n=1 Tax=Thioalkalivibrio sulfidiphilus TaxID=1033854 RepID=UPI00037CE7E6|nr:DUF3426 domain-containing protein [Thioalkalivibrio sulfidiphilus]